MILLASMWDDGLVSDLRLIDILRKLNITASFAISPSKHKKNRITNDNRGNYGTLVSFSELKEFSDFEVCNHGNNHLDFSKINYDQTFSEIVDGKKILEDYYQKNINGFCYPYGVYSKNALSILKNQKINFARITNCRNNIKDNLLLNPTHKWNKIDLNNIENYKKIIFWGHTYELETQNDWNKIKYIYQYITDNPLIKIVNFEEIIR